MSRKTPEVLVASLIQEEPWLDRFLGCLSQFDYPKKAIKYAFVIGKKIPLLHKWAKENTWMITFITFNPTLSDRFERLAQLRNFIIHDKALLLNTDYVLWIDSDVVDFPARLIKDLTKHHVAVVAPTVWIEGTNQFYDTLAFRFKNGQMFPEFAVPFEGLLEVSSVGTCYLAKSALYHKHNLKYHGGDSEHVTFCKEVHRIGEKVYVDFNTKIQHANLPFYGRRWH